MEEMKALVEPFPLVPDICIAFNRSRSDGYQSSQPSCFCRTPLAVIVEAHTSYPILRHHSIISGIAFLFMPLPDCLMACTMAKLVCNVLRAATASCDVDELEYSAGEKLLVTYCICAICHRCGRSGEAPCLEERFAEQEGKKGL